MYRTRNAIAILTLVLIFLGIRLLNLDGLVTTDEPFWLGRSGNFYRALRVGDFVNTYQMAHPGVLTMWAGAAAYWVIFPEYAHQLSGNLDDVYSIETVLRFMGQDPLELMVAAKVSKVILQSLFFAIGMIYLTRFVSTSATLIVGLLFAFSPFMSGYDSTLHVDGLFATVCFAAILSLSYAGFKCVSPARSPWWLPWVIAGVLSAASWLTRATGVVLFGVVGLVLIVAVFSRVSQGHRLGSELLLATKRGTIWLAASVISTFALLPALWVAPGSTLSKLWSWSSNAATEGHENPTFYRGIHMGDPGFLVYPEVLLWRTTPFEWLGLLLLALFFVFSSRKNVHLDRSLARLVLVLLVFAIVYVVAMSIGAKKFDRYVLPVFPVVTLLAGLGIASLIKWTKQANRMWVMTLASGVVALLVIGQIAAWYSTLPYRLDYFNPIMGGNTQAQHVLQMGWGQGGDEVVAQLEGESDGLPIIVQTTAVPSAFTYFLPNDSNIRFESFGLDTPAGWYETDYFVAGIQQTQRDLSPGYFRFADRQPLHTVDVGNVPYFEIYNVRRAPLPASLMAPTACNYEFGGRLKLMQVVGRDQTVDFYFLSTSEQETPPIDVEVVFRLPSEDYEMAASAVLTPESSGHMIKLSVEFHSNERPASLDQFDITIAMTINGSPLQVTASWMEQEDIHARVQSECFYLEPPEIALLDWRERITLEEYDESKASRKSHRVRREGLIHHGCRQKPPKG